MLSNKSDGPDLGPTLGVVVPIQASILVVIAALAVPFGTRAASWLTIALGVAEAGYGAWTLGSDWRTASQIVGRPPEWVDLVGSGWVNVAVGVLVVVTLFVAVKAMPPRAPRAPWSPRGY